MGKVANQYEAVKAFVDNKISRSLAAVFVAYMMTRVLELRAFADDGTAAFTNQVDTGGSTNVFADFMNGFIAPLQGFGASVLVVCMIIVGIKLGTSSMFGDPRGRMEAIKGIFFIVMGGLVIIHAKQIVGFAANITMGGGN